MGLQDLVCCGLWLAEAKNKNGNRVFQPWDQVVDMVQ